MYVEPARRGEGIGRALLDELLSAARDAGYERVRLDSPDFMTAAHGLYRSRGFTEIGPYPESEIPDEYKPHWIFMELPLLHERCTTTGNDRKRRATTSNETAWLRENCVVERVAETV
jgi:L-amino acid N-acyltransferase YncA